MTTKVNQEDMTTGEYIETIENTPSTSSIIPMKTENMDRDDLLLSSQRLLNHNIMCDEVLGSSNGSGDISETHKNDIKEEIIPSRALSAGESYK